MPRVDRTRESAAHITSGKTARSGNRLSPVALAEGLLVHERIFAAWCRDHPERALTEGSKVN